MTDQKNKQSSSDQGMKPSGGDQESKSTPHNQAKKPGYRDDTDSDAIRKGGEIENPDQQEPDKRVELDDNPDETRRKIPNM